MVQLLLSPRPGYERVTNQTLIEGRMVEIEVIEEDTSEVIDIVRDLDKAVSSQDGDSIHIGSNIKDIRNRTKKTNKKRQRWRKILAILGIVAIIVATILIII